ncbi:MAG: hypothetical protein GX666_02510 [Tissierellia bacterium]|nr:hypothetical protein [Tissierellia bacterium]
MKDYLTIRELLEMNFFKGSTLLAGSKGLVNKANNFVILETPEGMDWLKGNEIVITAGHAYINREELKRDLIKSAHRMNAAALVIKIGRYFGEIENQLIEDADELGIPIIVLDKSANYTELINDFYKLLFNKKNENLLEINSAYNKLLSLQINKATIQDIIKEVENLSGLDIQYKRFLDTDDKLIGGKILGISQTQDLGFLLIQGHKDGDEFQNNIIRYGMSLINNQLLLEKDLLYSISENHRMLTQLLLGNHDFDESFYESILISLKWREPKYYGVYFLTEKESTLETQEIRKYIEYLVGNLFLFNRSNDGIVVYLPFSKMDIKNLVEKIDNKFNSEYQQIKIGISLEKDSFKDLQTALDESKQIAKIAQRKISFLEDLPGERFLLDIAENQQIKGLFKTIIDDLKSYDENHGTELFETLITYIGNDLKRQKTADVMHIHIETLRYRLNKVEELTGLNLNKSKDLMAILIAAELYHYL